MNNLLYFVFSTFLLVQLCTAAFIPYQKYATYGGRSNRQHLVKQLGNNYIDEYETPTKKEDVTSRTCAYYNYEDECHGSNDGCGEQTETCTLKSSNRGCFTLWDGSGRMLQGCWLPSSRQDCTPGECVSSQGLFTSTSFQGTYFCCCFGDDCNRNYGISNHIPSW